MSEKSAIAKGRKVVIQVEAADAIFRTEQWRALEIRSQGHGMQAGRATVHPHVF